MLHARPQEAEAGHNERVAHKGPGVVAGGSWMAGALCWFTKAPPTSLTFGTQSHTPCAPCPHIHDWQQLGSGLLPPLAPSHPPNAQLNSPAHSPLVCAAPQGRCNRCPARPSLVAARRSAPAGLGAAPVRAASRGRNRRHQGRAVGGSKGAGGRRHLMRGSVSCTRHRCAGAGLSPSCPMPLGKRCKSTWWAHGNSRNSRAASAPLTAPTRCSPSNCCAGQHLHP